MEQTSDPKTFFYDNPYFFLFIENNIGYVIKFGLPCIFGTCSDLFTQPID